LRRGVGWTEAERAIAVNPDYASGSFWLAEIMNIIARPFLAASHRTGIGLLFNSSRRNTPYTSINPGT
jgi:hypothetical protein